MRWPALLDQFRTRPAEWCRSTWPIQVLLPLYARMLIVGILCNDLVLTNWDSLRSMKPGAKAVSIRGHRYERRSLGVGSHWPIKQRGTIYRSKQLRHGRRSFRTQCYRAKYSPAVLPNSAVWDRRPRGIGRQPRVKSST